MTDPNVTDPKKPSATDYDSPVSDFDTLHNVAGKPLPNGSSEFANVFTTSITELNLDDVDLPDLPNSRPLYVTECLINPSAPGRKTIVLNSTHPSQQAMAELIQTPKQLVQLVKLLSDYNLSKELTKKTFVTTTKQLRCGSIYASNPIYSDAVDACMPSADPAVRAFMTALFTLELAPMQITKPTKDLIFVQDKTERAASIDQIRIAAQEKHVAFVIKNYKPGVLVLNSKGFYEQAQIIADIAPRWTELARQLVDATRLNNYTQDTLYLVRAYVVADQARCPAPEELMNFDPLRRLAENISVVNAAFDSTVTNYISPAYELKEAVTYFATTIAQSTRLQTRRISEFGSEIGHIAMLNKTMSPVFVALYQNIAGEIGRSQASHLQAQLAEDSFRAQSKLTTVEARLNSFVDPIIANLTPAAAAALQCDMIGHVLQDIDATKPLVSKIMLDEEALKVYACYLSLNTFVSIDDMDNAVISYEMPTSGFNYVGRGELKDMIRTTSPELVAMLSNQHETSSLQRPPMQTIPEDLRDAYIAQPDKALFAALNRKIKIRPLIGENRYDLVLHLDRALGIEHIAGEAFMTRQPITELCVASFYKSVVDMHRLLGYYLADKPMMQPALRSAAHSIGAKLENIWHTPTVMALCKSIVQDVTMSKAMSREDRMYLKSQIQHSHALYFISTSIVHAIATRLGLISYDKAAELDALFIENETYFQLSRFM